ncbi:MAG TPA: hypothetical protein VFU22_34325, partial [Roseiflexaceae bacterium]|nr:hypothetical protein [Roseiflexaceae bacterium]
QAQHLLDALALACEAGVVGAAAQITRFIRERHSAARLLKLGDTGAQYLQLVYELSFGQALIAHIRH